MFFCHLFLHVCCVLGSQGPHAHELWLAHELHPWALHPHGHPALEAHKHINILSMPSLIQ